tara:strand:+ start:259 stop:474 length:216 start_codon:yes stop_codon:yes gene_type:complete
MEVTKKRSLLKMISWRTIASIDTLALTWLVTGDLAAGLTVSALEIVTKMCLYYFHERTWLRTKFGIKGTEK